MRGRVHRRTRVGQVPDPADVGVPFELVVVDAFESQRAGHDEPGGSATDDAVAAGVGVEDPRPRSWFSRRRVCASAA